MKFLGRQAYLPYIGPISLWIIVFAIIPLGVILYFSVLEGGAFGKITSTFSIENYRSLVGIRYAKVIALSLLFAFGTNMICLLIGYPLAYWIVKRADRWKILLLFLVILPSWTCYLIRLYALRTLAASTGLINSVLLSLGLISSPLQILYTPYAVMFGLVYSWLPFMVLPIYASLEGLDPSLSEAAVDLGATPLRRFFTVTLPLTKGGILAGTILVFIPALGEWLVPLLLGGSKFLLAGNLVSLYFIGIGNIPAGCAIATAITAIVVLIIYLCIKFGGKEALERIV